jgi:hypothetical protein
LSATLATQKKSEEADTPPRTTRAALAGARCPVQLTSFCSAPSKHLDKPANGSPGREAQRGGAPGPACAQGSPVRCGCARCRQARPAAVVRAHTHKHPRTEMPAVGSHATCAAALPSGSPPAPSSLSTQFRTVENCQLSNPTNFGLVFRSPRTLRVFGDLMSNISATRGRPDMRFCVCGSPSEDLSHIASLTIGCSR